MDPCVFLLILYTYFSRAPVRVLELCLCISFRASVRAKVPVNMQVCGRCLSVCETLGLNLPSGSNKGGGPLGSNRHSSCLRKGSDISSQSVGGKKKKILQIKQQQISKWDPYFLKSTSHFTSSGLALWDLIPTLHLLSSQHKFIEMFHVSKNIFHLVLLSAQITYNQANSK